MRLAFLLAALCAEIAAGAGAPATTAQKQELTELRERIGELQKRLEESEETKNEAADALRESERAISETRRALRDLGEQQREVDGKLAELRSQSAGAAGEVQTQQARLARVLYRHYIGAQPDAIKLLLNREDPHEVARQLHYLTYLARARAELIRNLRSNLDRLQDLSAETERQRVELASIQSEQQAQRKRLEGEQQARRDVLVKVSRQIEKQRREISTLRRDENRLARLIEQLTRMLARPKPQSSQSPQSPQSLRNERVPDAAIEGGPFGQLKGRLNLPVRGELRNRFGVPREDSGLSWKGLFIAAPSGNEVKAIAGGRVVFADWLRGFGNLLIVDHGGGYMSLYGNNESLYKQVGAVIRGGETVATVGNSGGNPDSGLYFELRHQGKAFDPLGWVNLR